VSLKTAAWAMKQTIDKLLLQSCNHPAGCDHRFVDPLSGPFRGIMKNECVKCGIEEPDNKVDESP